jgi:hypothetical protein
MAIKAQPKMDNNQPTQYDLKIFFFYFNLIKINEIRIYDVL